MCLGGSGSKCDGEITPVICAGDAVFVDIGPDSSGAGAYGLNFIGLDCPIEFFFRFGDGKVYHGSGERNGWIDESVHIHDVKSGFEGGPSGIVGAGW